jgi:flavin reductase
MSADVMPLAGNPVSVDPATFKAAMRRLAASVAVITSRHGDRLNGMTATAVCSVSSEPPLVLVVINRCSRSYPLIREGGTFALNFLREGQDDVADYFAARNDKSFDSLPHDFGLTGCPLLQDCAASVECVVHTASDSGSHTIFVGRVVNAKVRPVSPLLYYDGRFARLDIA